MASKYLNRAFKRITLVPASTTTYIDALNRPKILTAKMKKITTMYPETDEHDTFDEVGIFCLTILIFNCFPQNFI